MHPQARREGVRIEVEGDEFLLWEGERAHRVHPLTALVWRAADGTRTVQQLSAWVQEQLGMAVETQTVWSALDVLADAGLLVNRVTPPGGVARLSRRDLLRHAGVTGLAATALGVSLPGLALAQTAPETLDKAQEQKAKAAQGQEQALQQNREKRMKSEERDQKQTQAQTEKPAREEEQKKAQEEKLKQQQQQQQQQSQERIDKQPRERHEKLSREAQVKSEEQKLKQTQAQQEALEQKSKEAQTKKAR